MAVDTALDTATLAERFRHHLRVTDVSDGLDAVGGRFDSCLMDPEIRPLWRGCKFWGPAATMRLLPANETAPPGVYPESLMTWLKEKSLIEFPSDPAEMENAFFGSAPKGAVIVTSTNVYKEDGFWGSNGIMAIELAGFAGVVTEGACRDTDEVVAQKSLIACRSIGRTIFPGRSILAERGAPVSCGGVLVRPGDIVGCDGDGVIVVPAEIAEDVLRFAAKIAIDDKKGRRDLYEKLGKEPDESVDWEAAEAYFSDIL